MTSNRNDSVKILNHWYSFKSDISASFLKSNYAKLLARSICQNDVRRAFDKFIHTLIYASKTKIFSLVFMPMLLQIVTRDYIHSM